MADNSQQKNEAPGGGLEFPKKLAKENPVATRTRGQTPLEEVCDVLQKDNGQGIDFGKYIAVGVEGGNLLRLKRKSVRKIDKSGRAVQSTETVIELISLYDCKKHMNSSNKTIQLDAVQKTALENYRKKSA